MAQSGRRTRTRRALFIERMPAYNRGSNIKLCDETSVMIGVANSSSSAFVRAHDRMIGPSVVRRFMLDICALAMRLRDFVIIYTRFGTLESRPSLEI